MDKIREMELEIQEKKKELETLKKQKKESVRDGCVLTIDQYTDDQKIKEFEKLHEWMMDTLSEKEKTGYVDEDTSTYAFEELLGLIAKDHSKFWKYWGSL